MAIGVARLEALLTEQLQSGARLGELLISKRYITPQALQKCLALQQCRPFINLRRFPCDKALLNNGDCDFYLQYGLLPWRKIQGWTILVCSDMDAQNHALLKKRYGRKYLLLYCTARDHRLAMEQHYANFLEQRARTQILRQWPDLSAAHTVTPGQQQALLGAVSLLLGLVCLWPGTLGLSLLLAANALYLSSILFKYRLYYAGKRWKRRSQTTETDAAAPFRPLCPKSLPIYSILVPMYREAESIHRLLDSIRALEYPRYKLDVKLILERDDLDTYEALIQAAPEPFFDIIRVPYSLPRTKPKACSYALAFAKGDYVTIYDAEDQPEPMQLQKAVAAFAAAPPDIICLQARLNYYNWRENVLTKCFAIEYAVLFDQLLKGMEALKLPIPLGGTSNHIHLKRLRELHDWDPYNVTEDADLGIRLAMRGYRTQMLDSVTLEEAPISLKSWLKQRSRWIKGYMQTWLVYMRNPKALLNALGWRGVASFHLFIGAPCLIFLLSPLLWLLAACWSLGMFTAQPLAILSYLALGIMLIGYVCQLHFAFTALKQWQWQMPRVVCMLYPFYWVLHSAASIRAFWQLIWRPHYWEKTAHGITRFSHQANLKTMREVLQLRQGRA